MISSLVLQLPRSASFVGMSIGFSDTFTFYFIITDDKSIENIRTWWQTNMLFISLAIILIQEIIFVRGPLGAVIRGSVSNSGKNGVIVYFGLKV